MTSLEFRTITSVPKVLRSTRSVSTRRLDREFPAIHVNLSPYLYVAREAQGPGILHECDERNGDTDRDSQIGEYVRTVEHDSGELVRVGNICPVVSLFIGNTCGEPIWMCYKRWY